MIKEDFSIDELRGKWVILLDKHIIAFGDDIKKIIEEAREKHPSNKFVLARVPEQGTLIY